MLGKDVTLLLSRAGETAAVSFVDVVGGSASFRGTASASSIVRRGACGTERHELFVVG